MSSINKICIRGLLIFAGLLLISGCGASNTESSFDSDSGHPADWVTVHETSFLSSPGQCYECHGGDLGGGISGVSCFSASVNGIACHGPGHLADWSDPAAHGESAKAAPSTATGFAICQSCHGNDFAGGIVQISCFNSTSTCHEGVSAPAPHSREPWVYTERTHATTDEQNADVCAICHLSVPPGPPPGCYNNTLCHDDTVF